MILDLLNSNILKIFLFVFYILFSFKVLKSDKKLPIYFSLLVLIVALFHISFKLYPLSINQAINGDEGLYLAAGLGLYNINPILWGDIDFLTNGPIHIISFVIPKLFGFEGDFTNARIIWLIYSTLTLIFIFLTLKNIFKPRIALLAFLYPLVYFSNSAEFDLNYFYNEASSNILIALAAFLLSKNHQNAKPNHYWFDYLAYFLLGLAPYAKLQSVVICLAIVVFYFGLNFQKNVKIFPKYLIQSIFWGLLPSILLLIYLYKYNTLDNFYHFYLNTNLSYGSDEGLFSKIRRIFITRDGSSFLINYHLKHLFIVLFLFNSFTIFFKKTRNSALIYFLLLSIAAIYSIAKPGNSYGHYFTYLMLPLSIGFAVSFDIFFSYFEKNNIFLSIIQASYIILISLVFGYHLYLHNTITMKSFEGLGKITGVANEPIIRSKIAKYLIKNAENEKVNPRMAIYGCTASLHAETGFMQATHQNIVERLYGFQATDSTAIKFSRKMYLAALNKNRPLYFLVPTDSVACYHNFTITGMQRIPEIYNFLTKNYQKINQMDSFEIYKLNK